MARLASLTRPTAGEGNVIWYRSWLVERSPASARSQTSYCSSPSRNLETGRPPTRTRSVSAIVPTGTPRSLAASRSIDHLDLGLAERERRVEVDESRPSLSSAISWSAYAASWFRSGPARLTWNVCGRRPSLERRDVVDADAQVGVVLEELARLLLDRELVELGAGEESAHVAGDVPPAADRHGGVALLQVGDPDVDRPPRDVSLALDDPAPLGLADRREDVLGSLAASRSAPRARR